LPTAERLPKRWRKMAVPKGVILLGDVAARTDSSPSSAGFARGAGDGGQIGS
jgi:hypothetical protein